MKDLLTKRIFYLIDDNKIDLKINQRLLEFAEVASEIRSFQSGEAALLQIKGQGPLTDYAVILLDIQMPHMTGFQFVEEFKKLPSTLRSGFKIIMVSSTIDPEELNAVQSNDLALLFLPKPLNPDSLFIILQEWQQRLSI